MQYKYKYNTYTRKLFLVYLKFQFNRASLIFPGNPTIVSTPGLPLKSCQLKPWMDWGEAVYYFLVFLCPNVVGPLWSEKTPAERVPSERGLLSPAPTQLSQSACPANLALWGGSEGKAYRLYFPSALKGKGKWAILISNLILHIFLNVLENNLNN